MHPDFCLCSLFLVLGSLFLYLHNREQNENSHIPYSMRYNQWYKIFAVSVHQPPENTANQSRHYQHKVKRPDMHQCINECGNDKGFPFSVFPDQSILNVTTPEYFFGRTNDKQQTQYQQYFILSFFHRIDAIDLRPLS